MKIGIYDSFIIPKCGSLARHERSCLVDIQIFLSCSKSTAPNLNKRVNWILTFLVLLLHPATIAQAVPAAPFLNRLSQPDGTTFNARQWGDETKSGFETEDGYLILLDPSSRKWFYAVPNKNGILERTNMEVGRDLPPGDSRRIRTSPPGAIIEIPARPGNP